MGDGCGFLKGRDMIEWRDCKEKESG